jgi:hypothetical protein
MKSRHCSRTNQRAQNHTADVDFDFATSEADICARLVDDQYWHHRIKRAFETAGFKMRRIEHEEAHPVWQAWLTRVSFDLAPERRMAVKQLRKILLDGGIKIARDEFNVIDRRGNKLRCVFLLDLGYPGVWQPRPRSC